MLMYVYLNDRYLPCVSLSFSLLFQTKNNNKGWQEEQCKEQDHSPFSEEFIKKMEEWEHIKGLSKFPFCTVVKCMNTITSTNKNPKMYLIQLKCAYSR